MQQTTIGQLISQHLAKWALPLGGWFILEYLVRNYSVYNIFLNLVSYPMCLVTILALYYIVRRLRDTLMPEQSITGMQAWTFGVQLAFFAGLLEAMFVWIFNAYLFPNNLMEVHQALLAQSEEAMKLAEAANLNSGFLGETLQISSETLKEQPILSPIETAMSNLSNDIFAGMFLMIPIALILRKKKGGSNN